MTRYGLLLLLVATLATVHVAHADGHYKPGYKPVYTHKPSPPPALLAGSCKDTGYCFPKPISAVPSCPSGTQALPNDPSLCWKGACPHGSSLSHDQNGKPVCLSCPKGYSRDGSYCREDCPAGYDYDGKGFCVKKCKNAYTSYEHAGKQYCIEKCNRGEIAVGNVCINIKKWHSGACTKSCSQHPSPSYNNKNLYSSLSDPLASALRAFDSNADSNSALDSLAAALADDGDAYNSKDAVNSAVYAALASRGCKCSAVRPRHVQLIERRSCNTKPLIVSPVWTTTPSCPSSCNISHDRRSCACAVAPCPSGLVACTAGWKQAPICVTPNKVYGVDSCTVFTCPAVYAALDKNSVCAVAAAPVPAPTPGYYQG